jgi:hypothetical protein
MLTESVGVLTTAALAQQQPPSLASVIEMLVSQSLQPNDLQSIDTVPHVDLLRKLDELDLDK